MQQTSSALIRLLFLISGLASSGLAHAETNSERFQWMNQDSPERQAFVKAENERFRDLLEKSPNRSGIKKFFSDLYSKGETYGTIRLDATRTLKLVDTGLDKPTNLVLSDGTGEHVLFSSFSLKKKVEDSVFAAAVSPDQKTVYLVISQDGSIDQMTVVFVDLVNRQVLKPQLQLSENSIAWLSSTLILFESQYSNGHTTYSTYDFTTGQTTALPYTYLIDARLDYVLYVDQTSYVLLNRLNQSVVRIPYSAVARQIVTTDANTVTLYCAGETGMGELRRFAKTQTATGATDPGQTIAPEGARPLVGATALGMGLVATYRNGADRFLDLYDASGLPVGEIPVPVCCSVLAVNGQSGSQFRMELTSAVNENETFTYDLTKKSWDRDPDTTMLTSGPDHYATEIQYATSDDGTQVPVRLTRRVDLVPDHKRPVYFYSYGGFDEAARLDPVYDSPSLEFIKRGGILADPGLRGGNEYGPSWWKAALFANKIKTYQDLAQSARMMVAAGWTSPELISSTGTSNGGLTVAATALLFPGVFGLVIPVAGVDDMLAKDVLDPNPIGWSTEYGSDSDPAAIPYLTYESPVENAVNQGHTRFLIVAGLDDTRVNDAHSMKLEMALEQFGTPRETHLFSIKDAGHGVQAFVEGNIRSLEANTATWTWVFDQSRLAW